jgi:hypothetical protein
MSIYGQCPSCGGICGHTKKTGCQYGASQGAGMSDDEADKAKSWKGMDGAIAWHLIDRHAEGWNEVGAMMNAWLRANQKEAPHD